MNTDFRILPEERVGVIVFLNPHGAGPQQITTKMLELVPEFERAG